MKTAKNPQKLGARLAVVRQRAVTKKLTLLTPQQRELYHGIGESGLFTLEQALGSYAGVKRLRETVSQ